MTIKFSTLLRGVALVALLGVPMLVTGCAAFDHTHHAADDYITKVRHPCCDKACYSHVPAKPCCRYNDTCGERKCANPETCRLKCCYLKACDKARSCCSITSKAACPKPCCAKACAAERKCCKTSYAKPCCARACDAGKQSCKPGCAKPCCAKACGVKKQACDSARQAKECDATPTELAIL